MGIVAGWTWASGSFCPSLAICAPKSGVGFENCRTVASSMETDPCHGIDVISIDVIASYTCSSVASQEHPRKWAQCHNVFIFLRSFEAFLVFLLHPYIGYFWAKQQSQVYVAAFLHLSSSSPIFLVPYATYEWSCTNVNTTQWCL